MSKKRKRNPKFISCGPGGIHCFCCFPRPGTKARRLAFRAAKRRRKILDIRLSKYDY